MKSGAVSPRALAIFGKIAASLDLPLDRLVDGLSVPASELRSPRRGCSWNDYASLCDRIQLALGGPQGMEAAGAAFLDVPQLAAIARIAALFASPRRLYWAADRFGPDMFPQVQSKMTVLGPTTLEIRSTVNDGLPDSRAFHHFNSGVFQALPAMLGLPKAVTTLTFEGRTAVHLIRHPPSMSIWGRIKHLAIAFRSAQHAFEALQAQNEDLLLRIEELHRAQLVAEEASAMKSRFMANMSHEIRTPMNGVLGLVDLLLSTPLNSEQRAYADGIRSSATGLLSVINDVLDFSRLEVGRLRLDDQSYELRDLINELLLTFEPGARQRGLALGCTVSDRIPQTLSGDPNRLRQVLTNLLGNALKFTEVGRVELTAEIRTSEKGERLWLQVSDTGPGIQEAWRDRLFHPFVQVDDALTRSHGGTGLGLAISRQLVELMGGEIGFQSELGKGSRFWISVPLVAADTKALPLGDVAPAKPAETAAPLAPVLPVLVAAPAPPPVSDPGPSAAPAAPPSAPIDVAPAGPAPSPPPVAAPAMAAAEPRVLIVEDNLVNQKVLAGMLRRLGCPADCADNGQAGVDAFKHRNYRMVFMDCQMPVMDGFEATRELRRLCVGQQPVIVAVTAHAIEGYRDQCIEAGMDEFVTKPVKAKDLEELLDRLAPGLRPRPEQPAA